MSSRHAWLILLLVGGWGCGMAGADFGATAADGGTDSDAVDEPPLDSDGGRSATPDAGLGPKPGAFESGDINSCYDGHDNNADSAIDCSDESCAWLASCCVGRVGAGGVCCSPRAVPRLPPVDFACTSGPASACSGGLTTFGGDAAWIREGAFYPGGTDAADAGAWLEAPIDLTTERIVIDARLAPGVCETSTCREAIGVGLTTQSAFGATTQVRPLVGLVLSGARRTANVLVAGAIVFTHPLADTELGAADYSLVLEPTGRVQLSRDGVLLTTDPIAFEPALAAHLVLYGRNRNPSAGDPMGARAESLALSESTCDMPAAWRDRAELPVLDDGTVFTADVVRGPSIASDGTTRFIAFEHRGGVLTGRGETPGDATTFSLIDGINPVLIGRSTGFDGGGIRDPELVAHPAGGFVLFYSGVGSDGKSRIGRAIATGAEPTGFVADDAPVIDPPGDVEEIDAPTVAIDESGIWRLVARVRYADGSTELRLYRSEDGNGATWTPETSMLAELTRRDPASDLDSFDAHEIAAPSLLRHNGAWQLYFAGRLHSRWSIGLMVSDDLTVFRPEGDGAAVLAGDGAGFDAIGTLDPEVVADADGTLRLFHTGTDGARSHLGHASRPCALRGL